MQLARAYIEITTFCGLNCNFCEPKKSKKTDMDIALFENIHKQLHGKTKEISYHILGDPLTVDNLLEYLNISDKYGFSVSLTTSGFYFQKHPLSTLFHPAVKQINISLSSFFANEQISMSFDEYVKSICNMAQKSIASPKRFVNFRLWNDGDIRYLDFNKKVIKYLSEFFGTHVDIGSKKTKLAPYTILVKDFMFEWPSMTKEPKYTNGTCHAISSQIGFLVDGSVVPCCLDSNGDMSIGSIRENTLDSIINSEKSKVMLDGFKNNILVEDMCKTCGFRDARL